MFRMYDQATLLRNKKLAASMFTDRATQFVDRHRWALRLDANGHEIDEYDDKHTRYCVAESESTHCASVRIRPESGGSMTEKYFGSLWEHARGRLIGSHEVTRFCTAPQLDKSTRQIAVLHLLIGLCRHCVRNRIPSFFGVAYPGVWTTLKRYGWSSEKVAEFGDGRKMLLLCKWHADEPTVWHLQEQLAGRVSPPVSEVPLAA